MPVKGSRHVYYFFCIDQSPKTNILYIAAKQSIDVAAAFVFISQAGIYSASTENEDT